MKLDLGISILIESENENEYTFINLNSPNSIRNNNRSADNQVDESEMSGSERLPERNTLRVEQITKYFPHQYGKLKFLF